ncbi:hypothetical protein C5B93_04380 [Rathayibacter sp. AY1A2]|uniref:hypothetical protein n=1 Tax=Rathayibacter sp. AY1A2 TaxID=2080520 RepID=UPI000CE8F0B9|nr:hypothetical protein [Rathayibacter sp. AY1A2]PPF39285.1 hypothetical protein C5B93_04380 [Rathayibacter sp. AY1A2]
MTGPAGRGAASGRRTRAAAVVLSSALLLVGCAGAADPGPAVEDAAEAAAGGSFALAEVDGVDGSDFLVVCPYESPESVEERTGISWSGPDRSEDEGMQTLVVLDGGEVVTTSGLDRDRADFCSGDRWEPLPLDTRLAVSGAGAVSVE